MTTEQMTQHKFTAEIESIGKPFRGGDGWDILVDWKLPGSQYNQHISGQNWDDIEGYAVGQTHNWVLNRGNLKQGKDGKYTTDYFWDWDKSGTSTPPATQPGLDTYPTNAPDPHDEFTDAFAGKPDAPSGHESPNAGIKVEGVVRGHYENLAAEALKVQGLQLSGFNIRITRDLLYHELHNVPIMPKHWCYTHDVVWEESVKKEGQWYHKFGDAWCVEGQGLLDENGEPVEDTVII